MKGIIRKTREEITIVSYGGRIDRNDEQDYVSYIDSKGVEHPREKLNLYWDIEVIDDRQELARQQIQCTIAASEATKEAAIRTLNKRELVTQNIYAAIVSGIFSRGGSGYWKPEEVSDLTERYTSEFMEKFIKEDE